MNIENLAALVNAKQINGSSSWELLGYSAGGLNAAQAYAAFVRNEAEAKAAALNGALALVCEQNLASIAKAQSISAVVVDDVHAALSRLIRLLCADKSFYQASELECDIAKLQGYCVLKEDVFLDFADLIGANKLYFCSNSEYLHKLSAPYELPEADFMVFRAASLFFEDVQFGSLLFNGLQFCHLFNEPYSKIFQAANQAACNKPIKPVFDAVFLNPDATKAKFGSTHCAVIFTKSASIASVLAAAKIERCEDYASALRKNVSFYFGAEAEFLPQKAKADYSLFAD